MKTKEQKTKQQQVAYERCGIDLVNCVERMHKRGLAPELAAVLMLDKAVDLCCYIFGPEAAEEAIDMIVVEQLEELKNERNKTDES